MSPAQVTAWCPPGPRGQSASRSVAPGVMSCNVKIMPRLFMVDKYSLNSNYSLRPSLLMTPIIARHRV